MAGQYSENVGKNNEYNAAQVVLSDERLRIENLKRDRRVILDNKYPGVVDAYFNSFNEHVSTSGLEYPVVISTESNGIKITMADGKFPIYIWYTYKDESRKSTFLESIIGDFFNERLSSKCEKIKRNFKEKRREQVCNTREEFVEHYKNWIIAGKINKRTSILITRGAIKKNTSKQCILNALSMAPLAKYIHPSDPIMAMAYLERCNIKAGKKK